METKTCQACGQELPLEGFFRNRTKSDGRQGICIPCSSQQRAERLKKVVARRLELLTELRRAGCVICGENDTDVIDFHHIDQKGEQELSRLTYGAYGEERFLLELIKCVPLCANDHRRVHAGRFSLDRVQRYNIHVLRERLKQIGEDRDS